MNGRHDEIASAMPADLDSLPRLRGFRLRGTEMTRLEIFQSGYFCVKVVNRGSVYNDYKLFVTSY